MKRAQITMESLLLYGAAILVVLLAIAALTYFGVFDLGNLLPQRCNLEDTGMFKCEEWQLTKNTGSGAGQISIVVKNIAAKPITLQNNAKFEALGYVEDCESAAPSGDITPGGTKQITITCDKVNSDIGDRVKGELTIESKYTEGTLTTVTKGAVSAKVAEQ
jgi:hypothetical protein